jgi:curved DNA-binding protein
MFFFKEVGEFFEELFGRGFAGPDSTQGRRTFRMRGEDHHAKVLIDLEDSFSGATRSISLRVPELTEDGHVTTRVRTLGVRIPKGIRAGQHIRLAGQGAPGLGDGEPGDLYLEVEFTGHPLYSVDGGDIYLNLPVTPWEAALGASVKAPTPSGIIDLKIPVNSSQGRKLRLKGRGMPGKHVGDMYVVLQISLPPADSDVAKALYKQMAKELDFNPRTSMGVS